MLDHMADMKTTFDENILFAPYVMALIQTKTRFHGTTNSKHSPFRPFINEKGFSARDVTPFPDVEGDNDKNVPPVNDRPVDLAAQAMPPTPPPMQDVPPRPMQPQWAPPRGYFDP